MTSIWVLGSGKRHCPPDSGGFYASREEALKHPIFKHLGIDPNTFEHWAQTEDDYIELTEKPYNTHLVDTRLCKKLLGVDISWENCF
jgi:hypothetical protein